MHDRAISQMMVRVGLAVFGLLTLAVVALTLISERGLLAVGEREAELEALHQEIESIETENAEMRDEIGNLKDPYGGEVERRAREDLNLVFPGEVILADQDGVD
jgi:cell division protein FtsB